MLRNANTQDQNLWNCELYSHKLGSQGTSMFKLNTKLSYYFKLSFNLFNFNFHTSYALIFSLVYHPPNCSGRLETKSSKKKRWSEFIVPLHLLLPVYYQIFNRHPKEIKSNFFHSVRNFATKEIARVFFFSFVVVAGILCWNRAGSSSRNIYYMIFLYIFCGRNFLHGNKRKMKFLFLNFSNFFHAIFFFGLFLVFIFA